MAPLDDRSGRCNRRLPGIVLLAFLLSGCLLGRGETDSPFSGYRSDAPVTLEVSNSHWNDVTVYALVSGQRVRLGRVTAQTQERMELPSSARPETGSLQFLAVPLAARHSTIRSPTVIANPGDRVHWSLENNLALSTISVRR